MTRVAVLAVSAVLLACDGDRPTKPLESPTKTSRKRVDEPAKVDAPAKSTARPEPASVVPPAKHALALLVATPHPTLVGPLERITLEPQLTVGKARRQAPELLATTRPGSLTGPFTYTSIEWPGVAFDVVRMGQIDSAPDDWLVESLRIVMPRDGVAERLKTAWGDPHVEGTTSTWLAPAISLRADLHEERDLAANEIALTFRQYTPLESFIGTDPTRFGFEGGAPILGAKGSDLLKRFGRRIFDYNKIRLGHIEHGRMIELHFAGLLELGEEELPDHVVAGYSLEIGDDEAVSAMLEEAFGKPKPDRDNEYIRIYRKSPRLTFDGNELVVGIDPGL